MKTLKELLSIYRAKVDSKEVKERMARNYIEKYYNVAFYDWSEKKQRYTKIERGLEL